MERSPFRRGAANRGRTGTVLLPKDFKSFVSAYSTIAANSFVGLLHRYAVILPPFTDRVKQFAQRRISGAVLERLGRPSPRTDPKLEHILITGMFHAYFELILHVMPLPQAKTYLKDMRAFYTAGWMKIMGQ